MQPAGGRDGLFKPHAAFAEHQRAPRLGPLNFFFFLWWTFWIWSCDSSPVTWNCKPYQPQGTTNILFLSLRCFTLAFFLCRVVKVTFWLLPFCVPLPCRERIPTCRQWVYLKVVAKLRVQKYFGKWFFFLFGTCCLRMHFPYIHLYLPHQFMGV